MKQRIDMNQWLTKVFFFCSTSYYETLRRSLVRWTFRVVDMFIGHLYSICETSSGGHNFIRDTLSGSLSASVQQGSKFHVSILYIKRKKCNTLLYENSPTPFARLLLDTYLSSTIKIITSFRSKLFRATKPATCECRVSLTAIVFISIYAR